MSAFTSGDPSAPLLVIGQSPGAEEIERDTPFVGGSGRLLWALARQAGISRSDCYIVNVIGELPEGKDDKITPEQMDRWWDRFDQAVGQSHGKVAALLGGYALERALGLRGIESRRGYLLDRNDAQILTRPRFVQTVYKTRTKLHAKGDPRVVKVPSPATSPLPESLQWIIPTIHPAAVLYTKGQLAPSLQADLRRVRRALDGQLRPTRTHFTTAPRAMWPQRARAFDIETDGLSTRVTRIGIADEDGTVTLPWSPLAKQMTKEALQQPGVVKVAHNISFDLPRLEAQGLRVEPPHFDTMLAAAMLEPDLYKSLESVASLYLDSRPWKHLNVQQPAYYNARDASVTLELYGLLRDELDQTGQLKLFEHTIMPAVGVLCRMTARGIPLNLQTRDEWLTELRGQYDTAMKQWQSLAPTVNPNSPQAVADYLYRVRGLPQKMRRRKKGISETVDLLAVQELLTDHLMTHGDVLGALLNVRRFGKDLKTYADITPGEDGNVHPDYLPANKDEERKDAAGVIVGKGLAGTWRPTAKRPNIQNQPERARRMYQAPPGMLWYEWDYNQIEARIIASAAEDDELQRAISRGLHQTNMQLLGVDKVRAKNAFYGWSYGAGWKTLRGTFKQHGFDVSAAACKEMLQTFNARYFRTAQWRERQMSIARAQGWVSNPFGLRRYFPGLALERDREEGTQATAASNFLPQSTAAMILWHILVPFEQAVLKAGGHPLTTVHDSLSAALPPDTDTTEIEAVLTQEWPQIAPGFRVPVSRKVGLNWGTLTEVSLDPQAATQ